MTNKAMRLLSQLKDYMVIKNDIDRLASRLNSKEYKMIASYNLSGGGGGYGGSKVESFSIRRDELIRELEAKIKTIQDIDRAKGSHELTKRERDLIDHLASGQSLSSYARQNGIYKSHIYKIRDRALEKMVRCIENP